MSRFNPQFSVTPARADYSGIENAGRFLASGISQYAAQKRQEEEMKQQEEQAKNFLAAQFGGDKGTVNKYIKDFGVEGAAQRLQQDQQARISKVVNSIGSMDEAANSNAFKGLNPIEQGAVLQALQQQEEAKLKREKMLGEMANTQSLTNQREREQRVQGAQAQYETMDASPIEFMQRNPTELMQGYNQAQDAKAERARKEQELKTNQAKAEQVYATSAEALKAAEKEAPGAAVQVYPSNGGWSYNISRPADKTTTFADPSMIREIEAIAAREQLDWGEATKRWQELKKGSSPFTFFGTEAGTVTGIGR